MKTKLVMLLVTAFLVSASAAGDLGQLIPTSGEDGWKTVEIEGSVLAWTELDGAMRFRFSAPTRGWLAVGFGGGPAMKDASLLIGYVDEDGGHGRDDHGTSPVSHSPDADLGGSDDLEDMEFQEDEDQTVFSFTLPVEPSDSLDPELAPGTSVRILVAWGDRDAFSGMHSEAFTAMIEL
jgi:hypothetical protein